MKNIISIIVPIYNTEAYLDRCIRSLVEQVYPDLEIILADDGSTDASGEIGRCWMRKDDRIRYFYQENAGVSAARNLGLDKAQGDLIFFVDSDDFLEPDFCEILLNEMNSTNVDVIYCEVSFDMVYCGQVIRTYRNNWKKLLRYERVMGRNPWKYLIFGIAPHLCIPYLCRKRKNQ